MDNASKPPASDRCQLDQLVADGIAWAGRALGRSVTVVALEFDEIDTLRTDLGSAGVDALLDVVAGRLANLQTVTAVRDGDEFILVSRAPRSTFDAFSLADRVARTLARPTVVGSFEISLAASMGVCQSWSGTAESPMLLRDARFALDEAKRRGRGKVVVMTPELHRRRRNNRPEIRMQFEPVVSLRDGSVSTYEATVLHGLLPGFDDTDTSTFELLLDELGRTIAGWPLDVDVAFNVPCTQLFDPDFAGRVRAAAERHSLNPHRFVFEIDEREAAEDLLRTQLVVARLRGDGWDVGLDGFGPASSALETMAILPVQFAKIDISLEEDADPNSSDLEAILSAARSLRIATVATGIEALSVLALALAHKYDFAQGSLFGVQQTEPPF